MRILRCNTYSRREQERLNVRHELSRRTLGGLLLYSQGSLPSAPRVLDIGTGTGVWAMDMADEYRLDGAEVIGTDLSPIQPRLVRHLIGGRD